MSFKQIVLVLSIVFMSDSIIANPVSNKHNLLRLEVLTGVEAEVIKIALGRFHAEKLNISPHTYDLSVYLDGEKYIVLFSKMKNAPPGTIDPGYEVVISADTLEVIHSQFSR